jgi:hypothetical protein
MRSQGWGPRDGVSDFIREGKPELTGLLGLISFSNVLRQQEAFAMC